MSPEGSESLKLLVIGAHPDDCEFKVGGLATHYRRAGHEVLFVSVTDGGAGHQSLYGDPLVAIRRREAAAAAAILGLEYRVLDYPDGALQPTLDARQSLIRLIRSYAPDLLITHRPQDYHPDHRYTSQLVCDAAYLLTVPGIAPDVAALARDPVILYMSDDFQRPCPLRADVVLDIESALESIVDMLACHESQFYDWLPYNRGELDAVPRDPADRRQWLRMWYLRLIGPLAQTHRIAIAATYGQTRADQVEWIEAFEVCEYGSPLTADARHRLFPFLPV